MTPNQNNRTTTYYGDYRFKNKYQNLGGMDFVGGVSSQFVDSYSNIYGGSSGSPFNRLLNVSAYSEIERKIKNTLKKIFRDVIIWIAASDFTFISLFDNKIIESIFLLFNLYNLTISCPFFPEMGENKNFFFLSIRIIKFTNIENEHRTIFE